MGVILMILQTIEDRIKSLLLFLWNIIGEAVAWTQDEHALPQKLIRAGQITLAVMVFLVVLCIGGFVINNLLLKIIPASLIAITFFAFITIFQWVPRRFAKERDRKDMPWSTWQIMTKEQRDEWKHEYSREYALSIAVRSINGWLFWVVGILDLFILLEPWRAGNQLLVFGFLFLCWTFVHLFRFLGTLGITIKVIFAIILVLMFAVRLGMQTNNETALRIATWSHFKQSQSQIQRAAKDVFTEENKKEAMLISQQRIYQLRQGAELVDRNGDKVSLADNIAIVWVPDDKDQPTQPSILLGVYKQAYLPQPGSRTIFQRDANREVWVNFSDISRQIDLKIEPKARRQDDSNGRSAAINASTPPAKLISQNNQQSLPADSINQWIAISTITTSAAELAQGKVVSGGLTLRWPKNALLTSLTPTNSSIFPCGNNYVDNNGLVKFRKPNAPFEFEAPAFALVAQAQSETGFVSWPSPWAKPLLGRVRFGKGSPRADGVVMPLFKLPDTAQVILKINAPSGQNAPIVTWDSTPIQLEVVESR